VSNGVEPEAGNTLKPETSIYAESSSETPEKKKRITDDKQDTSVGEEDRNVESKAQGPTDQSPEDTKSKTSRLNRKYEISLADEKYVLFMQYS
jgi:hypothetical protein